MVIVLGLTLILLILVYYTLYQLGLYLQPSIRRPEAWPARAAWGLLGVPLLMLFLGILLVSLVYAVANW